MSDIPAFIQSQAKAWMAGTLRRNFADASVSVPPALAAFRPHVPIAIIFRIQMMQCAPENAEGRERSR
jgi:hypothetical protein